MCWNPLETLESTFGFWNAIVLVIVFAIAMFLAYLIYRKGNATFQEGTLQVEPFMSGNAIEDSEAAHIPADNIYWGYLELFRNYYKHLEEAHTGNINDYLHWFIVVLAIIFIVVTIGGA